MPIRNRFASATLIVVGCSTLVCSAARADPVPTTLAANEVGLTAESLTVAGLTPTDATVILTRVDSAAPLRTALATANDTLHAAADLVSALRTQLVSGDYDQGVPAAYDQALIDMSAARLAVEQARASLRDEALDGYSADAVEAVETWWVASAFRVEPAMRAMDQASDEWAEVERALRREARALRRGEELDPETAQLLANVRSDPDVQQAQTWLTLNGATIEAVFDQIGD